MTDRKHWHLDIHDVDEHTAAKTVFPNALRWRFWIGFMWGVIFMTTMNIGDLHICVGECDSKGFSFAEVLK